MGHLNVMEHFCAFRNRFSNQIDELKSKFQSANVVPLKNESDEPETKTENSSPKCHKKLLRLEHAIKVEKSYRILLNNQLNDFGISYLPKRVEKIYNE